MPIIPSPSNNVQEPTPLSTSLTSGVVQQEQEVPAIMYKDIQPEQGVSAIMHKDVQPTTTQITNTKDNH